MKQKLSDSPIFLQGLNQREEKALNELYRIKWPDLCYTANFIIGDIMHAQDIAARILISLNESNTQFNNIQHVENYLFQAIKWACNNHLKKQKTNKSKLLIAYDYELPDNTLTEEAVDNKMIQAELINAIYGEIEKFSAKDRELLKLWLFDNLKTIEIADRLGMKEQSVRNRKNKLIKDIRSIMIRKKLLILLLCFANPN